MRGSKHFTQQQVAAATRDSKSITDYRANATLLSSSMLKDPARRDGVSTEMRQGWVQAPTVQIGEGLLPPKEPSHRNMHEILMKQTHLRQASKAARVTRLPSQDMYNSYLKLDQRQFDTINCFITKFMG